MIVDDVSYPDEPMFQDGVVATAIDDVEASGVTYFSSAANTNMVANGQDVGSYEAPAYRPSRCPAAVVMNGETDCHDFDPTGGTASHDLLTVPGDTTNERNVVSVALGWSQPQFGIATDLDLYLLDQAGRIVANWGGLTDRQFVERVYQVVLGRSGDPQAVTYWTNLLGQHKKTRGEVIIAFSETTTARTRRAGEVNTVDVFFGMLRRVPTAAELRTWTPLTKTSKIALINSLLGSHAYDARV